MGLDCRVNNSAAGRANDIIIEVVDDGNEYNKDRIHTTLLMLLPELQVSKGERGVKSQEFKSMTDSAFFEKKR